MTKSMTCSTRKNSTKNTMNINIERLCPRKVLPLLDAKRILKYKVITIPSPTCQACHREKS
jgi:hypothetical protein